MELFESKFKNYMPMSEAGFLILSTLIQAQHGYSIIQEIEEKTKGRVKLGAGTVYTVLGKMEADDIIRVVENIGRRKVYEITDIGRKLLEIESRRILELGVIAEEVLGNGCEN